MQSRIPGVPAVMTGVAGLFMLIAGFGSVIPGFVKDRMPEQFIPIGQWVVGKFTDGPASEGAVMAFAHASQWIIACTEWAIGLSLLAATFMPSKRLALTNFGVGLFVGLMGAFMIMLFMMHDYNLPRWSQFPAILAWLGVTWMMVSMEASKAK